MALDGICEGVDNDGALLLATTAGVRRILSGDVSLRRA
jgi:BirA family biotin operon repressor/biotin-[acetyl-CoA-carboxylase] ligase